MNAVIPNDIAIDEAILSRIIDEQFGLRAQRISFLGAGFDNAVYLVNDQWVFRLPRRAIAVELIETEMKILPLLKDRLPLKIPTPVFYGQPSADFPRPFYGHALIAGQPGSSLTFTQDEYDAAARTLAHCLKVLHAIDIREKNIAGVIPRPLVARDDYQKLRPIFDRRLRSIELSYDLSGFQKKFDAICNDAQAYTPSSREVIVHGDMYHRHLIFDKKNSLAGLIDWGDSSIGNAVSDLGIGYQFFSPHARAVFFEAYGESDQNILNYARFIGLYYAVALLWFGHDRHDKDLIRTSLWTFANI